MKTIPQILSLTNVCIAIKCHKCIFLKIRTTLIYVSGYVSWRFDDCLLPCFVAWLFIMSFEQIKCALQCSLRVFFLKKNKVVEMSTDKLLSCGLTFCGQRLVRLVMQLCCYLYFHQHGGQCHVFSSGAWQRLWCYQHILAQSAQSGIVYTQPATCQFTRLSSKIQNVDLFPIKERTSVLELSWPLSMVLLGFSLCTGLYT